MTALLAILLQGELPCVPEKPCDPCDVGLTDPDCAAGPQLAHDFYGRCLPGEQGFEGQPCVDAPWAAEVAPDPTEEYPFCEA